MVGELLFDLLGLLGYQPEYCDSPIRALELLETTNYDLVVSDYRMPEMTGQEFYDRAVGQDAALARRIIFLTGDTVSDETEFFFRSTGSTHLSKPFQFEKVKAVIEEVLEKNAAAIVS